MGYVHSFLPLVAWNYVEHDVVGDVNDSLLEGGGAGALGIN